MIGLMRFCEDPIKEQHQILCKSWKMCGKNPGNDWTSVWGRKHEPYMESPNSPRKKKAGQVKSKFNSMLVTFFNIRGIVHKELILECQTVTSTYYCDVLRQLHENVQRLYPELWQQKNWLLPHDNAPSHTSFLTREFLAKTNITVPRPPPILCFLD
jgi:hypothetical protein